MPDWHVRHELEILSSYSPTQKQLNSVPASVIKDGQGLLTTRRVADVIWKVEPSKAVLGRWTYTIFSGMKGDMGTGSLVREKRDQRLEFLDEEELDVETPPVQSEDVFIVFQSRSRKPFAIHGSMMTAAARPIP